MLRIVGFLSAVFFPPCVGVFWGFLLQRDGQRSTYNKAAPARINTHVCWHVPPEFDLCSFVLVCSCNALVHWPIKGGICAETESPCQIFAWLRFSVCFSQIILVFVALNGGESNACSSVRLIAVCLPNILELDPNSYYTKENIHQLDERLANSAC